MVVIGRNIGKIPVGVDAGIDDGYGDIFLRGVLHHGNQRFAVRRGEHNPRYMLIDKIVDDIDLAAQIDFRGGPVPYDLHAQFPARRYRARMHALPEDVGLSFRHDGDHAFMRAIAGARTNQAKQPGDYNPTPRDWHGD